MKRKIIAVITAITEDRVIVTDEAIAHIIEEHFRGVPRGIILETIERVLRDPSDLYREEQTKSKKYDFFYRLETGEFIVAVVKIIPEGAFLSSLYPTGKQQRNKHKGFKKIKL
jgi:hypothetical protein